jgi:hypothetical protein
MSAKMKNYLIIASIAAAVVWASNNVNMIEDYIG